jgi:uncharacterized protein (DUF305 family)
MKKSTQVFLILALVVLLGMAATLSFLLLGDPQEDLLTQRSGMPMFMQPGMMRMSGASIRSEYEFLVHMIPHHEEAVLTANILKNNTNRQEMRQFADGIISTQTDEIEQMKAWLEEWYPDKDHELEYQPMMRNLEGLTGDALDEVFIEDMIPHHMAAVMMSQRLLARGLAEHEGVAALAREIRDNQRDEIHLMMRWLSDWDSIGSNTSNLIRMMMWIGLLVMVILISIVIWLMISLSSRKKPTISTILSAKELLDIRYAKGDISQEEYRETLMNLEK